MSDVADDPHGLMVEDHAIDGDGGRLFARSWTPGSAASQVPIVLLHDSLGAVALWREFPARLAAATRRRVVAYDRLGFGRSDPHPGRLGPDFIAAEARGGFARVLSALAIDAFVVFGHSVGGGMAVHCAAAFAGRCRGLATESAQAFVEDRTLQGIRDAQRGFAAPGGLARLEPYHGARSAWVLDAWTATWLSPAFAAWSLDAVLPRVRCPTLVLHGALDEYGSEAHPRRIAACVDAAASLHLLPEVGHVPHRTAAGAVLATFAAWLAANVAD